MARNLALALASAALSLVLAEGVLRLFVPLRDIGPSLTVADPQLGKRLKRNATLERVTPEFRMRLSTNSLGFRGHDPAHGKGRPLLFLGDSFTMGYGVNDGEEFPALVGEALRREHKDVWVWNAGIGDAGNGHWLKLLRGEAASLEPRLVVMQVIYNDFDDNPRDGLFALASSGGLRELPVPRPGMARRAWELSEAAGISSLHLAALARQTGAALRARAARSARDPEPASDELTYRIVEAALAQCHARGWSVLGLLVSLDAQREASLRSLFARYGAPVVRVESRRERPQLYYPIDGHWNRAGHEYAAARVLEVAGAPLAPTAR
jgi:hypothetical protein